MKKASVWVFAGIADILLRLRLLVFQPFFIALTLIWHGCILSGALVFFHFEAGTNPKVNSYLDCLYWVLSTVTTTGYGDITPITDQGKLLAMALMVLGIVFVWTYTALIAGALVSPQLSRIESEFHGLEKSVAHFEKELRYDERKIGDLIERLERLRNATKPKKD